jgi:UPF0271 protein
MPRPHPFFNIDAGELPDEPDELIALAHVVNVACGGHAGDRASMEHTLALCKQLGTEAGAHPSFPDREGFGRKIVAVAPDALRASVAAQCHALASVARALDVPLQFVKPHGALYHAANRDRALAEATLRGAVEALGDALTVLGPPSGALRDVATELGLAFAREGFADRAMRADGSLVPRGEPGAMIDQPAEAAAQAKALASTVDTICVHGDTPGALAIARAVRRALA